eukprot:10010610-Alexandrium_andersonii.AAC.1
MASPVLAGGGALLAMGMGRLVSAAGADVASSAPCIQAWRQPRMARARRRTSSGRAGGDPRSAHPLLR